MNEHPSLTFKQKPKPLAETAEITQVAKEAVLKQVNSEIRRLTEQQTDSQQILQILGEIKDEIAKSNQENEKAISLKLDVLQRLRAKLETTF